MSVEPTSVRVPRQAGVPAERGAVLARLRRRPLFRLAVWLFLALAGSAVFAPLLANDRPYMIVGVDYRAFEQARKILVPATQDLVDLLGKAPQAAALADQKHAVTSRLALLARSLPEGRGVDLTAFEGELERAVALARAGRASEATAAAAPLRARAEELRDALVPIRPGTPGGLVELVPRTSFPLLEATSGAEVACMLLFLAVLLVRPWGRLVARFEARPAPESAGTHAAARARRSRTLARALPFALALLGGLLWQVLVGGERTFHTASFKDALMRGDVVATRAVFPPIPLGFAETHLEEAYRPPSWTAATPVDGGAPVRAAVEVRYGEPAASSPWRHVLGTDSLGRDLLARLLWGGRVSLAVGLVSTVLLMTIGILVGALAGYLGGRTDLLLSRAIEVVMCFPAFFLVLVVVAFLGPSVVTIVIVLGALRWTGVARLARGEFLRLRELDFVVAARAAGLSTPRIVLRHVLPNAAAPLLVAASFALASSVLVESSLSFLHFGIQDPIPSWGALINESRKAEHWWIHVFPGLLIFLTVLAANLAGDAVRDALDPKHEAPS